MIRKKLERYRYYNPYHLKLYRKYLPPLKPFSKKILRIRNLSELFQVTIHSKMHIPVHTGLTRVSSIRFLLFEIKCVLVYNSIIICLFYTFSFKMHMPTKKYLIEKANKLCLMGQIVIESHSFLEY